MAEFSSSTGIALRVARQARGLTQQQLAGMAGVTYDAGTWVADLGYRLIYMPKISNYNTAPAPVGPFSLNDNLVNEIRGTVRYRF